MLNSNSPMTSAPRYTWEKLTEELRALRDDDGGSLAHLCLAIHSVLEPNENFEACFRQIQFLGFELREVAGDVDPDQRWSALRAFVFDTKKFAVAGTRGQVHECDVLMKEVLTHRAGHPLLLAFVILHLARVVDLPLEMLHAKHHYLLKWVRPGKTVYLDIFNHCAALNDQQLITMINRTSSRLETHGARKLVTMYLDVLARAFEFSDRLGQLHGTYDLMLLLDEMDVAALGRRALLRRRLGMDREARSDLKRYFSFIELSAAPFELRDAWRAYEEPPAPRAPPNLLH